MKQLVLLFACALTFCIGHSQTSFDLKAGINASNIVGKDIDGYKTKMGLHFGAAARIPISSSLGLQPEIFYSAEGAKWEGGGKTLLNYLRIPALLSYAAPSGFSAVTGPQLGFLLSAKDEEGKEKTDIKEYLKTTDLSWAFGVSYAINPSLSVNARYNIGLTKFYEEEKNSSFQIGVYYRLRSQHKTK